MFNWDEILNKENYFKISVLFKEIVAMLFGILYGVLGIRTYYSIVVFIIGLFLATRTFFTQYKKFD